MNKAYSKFNNFIIFIFFLIVIYLRSPLLINYPRFWAEEGIWYFEKAFNSSNCFTLLFNFGDQAAYYLFLPRLIGSLSCSVDISYAPTITTFWGLIFILIPIIIILNYQKVSYIEKIILVSVYLFSVTSGEAWLNSTNLGFILPIIFFLIVMDNNPNTKTKLFSYYLLVFLALTTGVMSIILSPILFIKYFKSKNKFLRNLIFLCFFAFIFQATYFIFSLYYDLLSTGRFNNFNLIKFLVNYLSYNYVYSLFGYLFSVIIRYSYDIYVFKDLVLQEYVLNILQFSDLLKNIFIFSIENYYLFILLILSIVIFFVILINIIIRNLDTLDKVIFLYVIFVFAIIIQALSLDMHGEYRYSMISNFAFLYYLIKVSIINKRIIYKLLIFLSIVIGIFEYRLKLNNYIDSDWPKWKDEVKIWELDHSYKIKIWPYKRDQYFIWKEKKEIFFLNLED